MADLGFGLGFGPSVPVQTRNIYTFALASLQAGQESLNVLGGDLKASAANRSQLSDRGAATPMGAPIVNARWLGLKTGSNYLDLPFGDFEEMTLMAIARSTDLNTSAAAQPVLVGTSDGTPSGASLYVGSATSHRTIAYYAGGNAMGSNVPGAGLNSWSVLVSRVGATGPVGVKTKNMLDGDEGAGVNTGARVLGGHLKIGGGPGSSFGGTSDIAFVAVWSRQLSDAEIDAAYAQLKPEYASYGIPI